MVSDIVRQRPLTSLQQGMVYHHLREGGASGVDVVQVEVRLPEAVDAAALRESWDFVTRREPALRMFVRWDGESEPQGEIADDANPPFDQVDLSGFTDDERDARFRTLLHADELRGFRLDHPPLQRLTLYRFGAEDYRLVWTLHHLLADGRSYALVLRDVFARYDGARGCNGMVLPDHPGIEPFHEWLASRDRSEDRAFWEPRVAAIEAPQRLPGERPDRESRAPSARTYLHGEVGPEHTHRLRELARVHGATLNTVVHAAWALTLSRFGQGPDVTFGAIRGGRAGTVEGADQMVGVFIRTVPVSVSVEDTSLAELLSTLREEWVAMRPHEHVSPADLQRWSGRAPGSLLYRSILNVQDPFWGEGLWDGRSVVLHNRLVYPLTIAANLGDRIEIRFELDPVDFEDGAVDRLHEAFLTALRSFADTPERPLGELDLIPPADRARLLDWSSGPGLTDSEMEDTVPAMFDRAARTRPDEPALRFGETVWSYSELDRRASSLAADIAARGVGPGDRVGIRMARCPALVAALLGVMRSGAAYVPLDPDYPDDRNEWIARDAGLSEVIDADHPGLAPGGRDPASGAPDGAGSPGGPGPHDPAYVMYTSGSTGRPKGVVVEHRNVAAFFRGMDEAVGSPEGQRWLALTSVSFDISVLELLWTLTRGATVVIHPERAREGMPDPVATSASRSAIAPLIPAGSDAHPAGSNAHPAVSNAHPASSNAHPAGSDAHHAAMQFSLFYFSAEGGEGEAPPAPGSTRYRLLLEGSRIADREGLHAIWTPERHFHEFGGIYPNPSVAGAAVAAVTERVRIRAGSIVLPLHDPVRAAEEWAVVDNLSDGRVDLAFASGWHDRDFVFAPGSYDDRKEEMFRGIETLQALWRGEAVRREAPSGPVDVSIHPRPVQPELPIWITAGGSPETFRRAGELGANLLTHLLGQRPEELEEKIEIYRKARRAAGHPGRGHVSLMLHTFLGTDREAVRSAVWTPFRNYLRTSMGLIAAVSEGDGRELREADISDEEMEALLDHAFERYFETSALMGTVEDGVEIVESLRARGVDEIACLVDFGVDEDATLEGIARIGELMRRVTPGGSSDSGVRVSADRRHEAPKLPASVDEAIERYEIRHLQCTPSTARLILAGGGDRLGSLDTLLIGGEAFPVSLARELKARAPGTRILNMYGPTETTIWSAVHELSSEPEDGSVVPIGGPIAGTSLHVADAAERLVPLGVEGELLIGGRGVARGYLDREELTRERFVVSRIPQVDGILYRTGDRVRRRDDGVLEFLGRVDDQLKVRGHRVEPGEIEESLRTHPAVRAAAVALRDEGEPAGESEQPPSSVDAILVGYLVQKEDVSARPSDDTLREHLRARLPEVMIPARFVWLDELPLTPNAKVDRRRLPAPRAEPVSADPTEPLEVDGLEGRIAAIWREVLGRADVGLDDNFFDLGGHSLLTIRVHSKLSADLGHKVPLTHLFRYPTIRSLADHLGGGGEDEDRALDEVRDRGRARREALRARRTRGRSG